MRQGTRAGTWGIKGRGIGNRAFRVCVWIFVAGCTRAFAQFATLDPAFPAGGAPDGFVRTLAIQVDGRVLVSGTFTNLGNLAQPRLGRLNADGSPDPSFRVQLDSGPTIVAPLGDGRVFIAGYFTNVDGVSRPGIAVLTPDGSLDPSFNPPTPKRWSTIAGGQPVPDGSIWVFGSFTNLGGATCIHLARLLGDGSLDAAFQSPLAPTNTVSILGTRADGAVLVAGNFHAIAGTSTEGIARLNPDGSVDPSFQSGLAANSRVYRVLLLPDGSLLASVAPGPGYATGPTRLVRLNVDGSLDPGFRVTLDYAAAPYGFGAVTALAVQSDGRILLGGNFVRVNGTPRTTIARLFPDGTLDNCFDLGLAINGFALALAPNLDGSILAGGSFSQQNRPAGSLARLIPPPDCDPGVIEFAVPTILTTGNAPRVVVPVVRQGGAELEQTADFTTIDGTAGSGTDYEPTRGTVHFAPGERSQSVSIPLRHGMGTSLGGVFNLVLQSAGGGATLGTQTLVMVTIQPAPPGTAGAPDTNFVTQLDGPVNQVLAMPDGRVLIAGAFTNVNGRLSPGLARLMPDGSSDTAFVRRQRLDGPIASLALQPDGSVLAAGSFRTVDGVWRPGLARFNPDGSTDSTFAPFASWPTNLFGFWPQIDQAIVLTEGDILCRGLVPGSTSAIQGGLFKLSVAGVIDKEFTNRFPPSLEAGALVALDNGGFLLGSYGFLDFLTRLDADGNVDAGFYPSPDWQLVPYDLQLALMPDHRVVVSGAPGSFQGLPDQPPLWRLNPDGSRDTGFAFSNAVGSLGQVNVQTFAVTPDARVLVGGSFATQADSTVHLVGLNADGSWDPSFDEGKGFLARTNSAVALNTLVALPAGGWLAGGDFGGYDGFKQRFLVKLLPETLARPLQFQWTVTNLYVTETNGPLALEVRRRGDASGPASVTVRTVDGSATAGVDFAPLDTTLTFAPGQWSQTVALDILDDRIVEGLEQFSVALTNAAGGFGLGQPSILTINVNNVETGVEFVTNSFHGFEEDGFVLAWVRWNGPVTPSLKAQVTITPEAGSANDLLSQPLFVSQPGVLGQQTTNWLRIGMLDGPRHRPTRRFRLNLASAPNIIPGPRASTELLVDDQDFATAPSRGVAGVVEAMANSPDGGVYLAGDFTGIHGVPRVRVARLQPDGEVDPAFDPGTGPDANVTALAVQADGKVLIGGDFHSVGGVSRAQIARLNPDGSLDPQFDPGAGPAGSPPPPASSYVRALLPRKDGSLWVAGAFMEFNHQPISDLVRLYPDGSLDTSFASPFVPSGFDRHLTGDDSMIYSLVPQSANTIVVVGRMYVGSGLQPSPVSVVQLDPTRVGSTGLPIILSIPANFPALAAALTPDGRILVGGTGLTNLGSPLLTGTTNWVAIQRFSTNGATDPGFQVRNAPAIPFRSSRVRQLLVEADGRILFAADITTNASAISLDPVPDRTVIGRLLPDGRWDSSFRLLTCALPLLQTTGPFWFDAPPPLPVRYPKFFPVAVPPIPTVYLTAQPDGRLVLAGALDSVNGQPRRRLARLDPDGGLRGQLELSVSSAPPGRLRVPGEVEVPYRVETSIDLNQWSPWLTNAQPWEPLETTFPTNGTTRFFRARGPE